MGGDLSESISLGHFPSCRLPVYPAHSFKGKAVSGRGKLRDLTKRDSVGTGKHTAGTELAFFPCVPFSCPLLHARARSVLNFL
jgi:hypothetical protein